MRQIFIHVFTFLSLLNSDVFSQVTSEQLHYGAASLSMANSDIALPETSWSAFVNPAGLVNQKGLTLVASSQSHFSQSFINHSLFGVQFKNPKYGSLGISVENSSVNYSGNELVTETAIGLHQGIALRTDGISSFTIGYGIKSYSIEYGNSAGPSGDGSDGISLGALNTFGLDISFLGSLGDRIRAGAKAFNINSPSLGNANNATRLPQRAQIGLAYSPYDLVWTTVALNKSVGHSTNFSSGFSYEISKRFILRSGMQTSPNRFSSGFEFHFKNVNVSYGFITHPVMPSSHQISFELNR